MKTEGIIPVLAAGLVLALAADGQGGRMGITEQAKATVTTLGKGILQGVGFGIGGLIVAWMFREWIRKYELRT